MKINTSMLKQILPYVAAVVILTLLYSFGSYPLLRKNNEAKKLLENKLRTLKEISSSSLGPPSTELITAMEKSNMELTEKYLKFREKLPIAKEFSLPEGVSLPLFFLEESKNINNELRAKAEKKGVRILMENLGLPNILPSQEEAPNLIKNLYVIETIVNLLIEAGVDSIDSIEVGGIEGLEGGRRIGSSISTTGGQTSMYEDIPLILTVSCDILSLTNLLFTLENTDKGFFIVRGFSLVSTGGTGEVTTRLTSSAAGGGSRLNVPQGGRGAGIETEEVKRIQTSLELSVIRWRGG
jgi:hypothetical protein